MALYVGHWRSDGTFKYYPTDPGGNPVEFTLGTGDNWLVFTDPAVPLTKAQVPTLVAELSTAGATNLAIATRGDLDAAALRSFQDMSPRPLCWLSLSKAFQRQDLAGLSALTGLRGLQVHGIQLQNADLEVLKPLSELRYLNLMNTKVSDLSRLQGHLGKLTDLYLAGNGVVGSSSLAFLTSLKGLRTLDVSGTGMTEADLRNFFGRSTLVCFDFQGIDITDGFLRGLCDATNPWETLGIDAKRLTDAGLEKIGQLQRLDLLLLRTPLLTDAGLRPLASTSVEATLRELDLMETPIGDGALCHLEGMGKLEFLFLDKTKTTAAGRAGLRTKLPACKILPEP